MQQIPLWNRQQQICWFLNLGKELRGVGGEGVGGRGSAFATNLSLIQLQLYMIVLFKGVQLTHQ